MLSVFLHPLLGKCKAKFCFRLPAFVCWHRGRFDFETFGLWIPKVSKSKQPRGLKCCGIASILVACASQPILAAVCARFAIKNCSSKENVVRVMYVCVCMCVCMCVCVYVLVYANVSVYVRKGLEKSPQLVHHNCDTHKNYIRSISVGRTYLTVTSSAVPLAEHI